MTKKEMQRKENEIVVNWYEWFCDYAAENTPTTTERLRHCQAKILRYDIYDRYNVFALKSYETIVAAYVHYGDCTIFIDFLRYVYGYTATSAQHISKFFNLFPAPDYKHTYRNL